MTITFTVYTRDKLPRDNIVALLSSTDVTHVDDRTFLSIPSGKKSISLTLKSEPEIPLTEYETPHLTRNMPSELQKKCRQDSARVGRKYGVVTQGSYFYVDTELHDISKLYPDLPTTFPQLEKTWRLLSIADGKPLYRTDLDTFIGATVPTIQRMAALAAYLAHTYHGQVYDPQTDSWNAIDALDLHNKCSNFFDQVSLLTQPKMLEKLVKQ